MYQSGLNPRTERAQRALQSTEEREEKFQGRNGCIPEGLLLSSSYCDDGEAAEKQLQSHLDTAECQDAEDPKPPLEHQLQERMQVQQLLCHLSKHLNP